MTTEADTTTILNDDFEYKPDMVIPSQDKTGLTFSWLSDEVEIDVNLVRSGARRTVYGEFTIKRPMTIPIISHDNIELTSRNDRIRLVKDLIDNHNSPDITFPWERIIEYVCRKVIEQYRQCEPPIQIRDIKVEENSEYRIDPIVREHESTIFYGLPDSGKTFLACLGAVITQDGIVLTDLNWLPNPGNVLMLDYDDFEAKTKQRITALRNYLWPLHGTPTLNQDVVYQRMSTPIAESCQYIETLIDNYGIDLVIADGLGYAIGGDTQKEQTTIEMWQAVRSWNTTFWGIDHISKNGSEDSPFGSIYKLAGMRGGFLIKGNRPSPYKLNVGLINKKHNNSGGVTEQAVNFEFVYQDNNFKKKLEKIIVTKGDAADMPEMAEQQSIPDRMAAYLSDVGMKTTKQIGAALNKSQDTIRAIANRDPRFIKDGDKWGVIK
jgi:hypothetical protein